MFPPPPSTSSRRARSRYAVLAAVLIVLLLAGCTGRKPTPTGYGDTTRRNFLAGCNESADGANLSNPQDYCRCSYEAIVETIPYDQFKEINSNLADEPAALPAPMLEIRDRCIEETSGSG